MKITYELVKELKEVWEKNNTQLHKKMVIGDEEYYNDPKQLKHVPTLEELIEACEKLAKDDITFSNNYIAITDDGVSNANWFAGIYNWIDGSWVYVCGYKTLIEAVAKLYIALNKKDA